MRLLCLLICFAGLLAGPALAEAPASLERWDRVVALQTKRESTSKHATAFLICKGKDVYLVTAHHAASETTGESRLLCLMADGQSRWFMLRGLFPKDTNPWVQYRNSDLAIARLEPEGDEREMMAALRAIALPFDGLLEQVPRRTTRVEFVGFPMALGTMPPISAIVVPGNVVSRELTAETQWGREPIVYATPAIASGTSGGPIFIATDQEEDPAIVGMHVGVEADETGGKLSKLVPARIIRIAIESHPIASDESAAPTPQISKPVSESDG